MADTSLIAHSAKQGGFVMPGKAAKVTITERQQEHLQALVRRTTAPQRLVQRARIILRAFEGWKNDRIAEHLRCQRHQVGIWRQRWQNAGRQLTLAEGEEGIEGLGEPTED